MRRHTRRRRRNPSGQEWLGWALAAGLVGLGTYAVTRTEWAKLARLEPQTRERVSRLLDRLRARGIEVFVGSTRRTEEEQARLVAEGKSGATISWHLVGRAVDLYPMIPGTRTPDWNASRPDLFRTMHQEWAKLGGHGLAYSPYPDGPTRLITASGRKIWDGGHIEFHGPYATAAAAYKAQQAAA